jgi:hypothetical protein
LQANRDYLSASHLRAEDWKQPALWRGPHPNFFNLTLADTCPFGYHLPLPDRPLGVVRLTSPTQLKESQDVALQKEGRKEGRKHG